MEKEQSDKRGELGLTEWVLERLDNCQRIAAGKAPGADRDGWLEDAAYFSAILMALSTAPASAPSHALQNNAAAQEPSGKSPGTGGNAGYEQKASRGAPVRDVPVAAAPSTTPQKPAAWLGRQVNAEGHLNVASVSLSKAMLMTHGQFRPEEVGPLYTASAIARSEIIEECAKVCERLVHAGSKTDLKMVCAMDEIRALKNRADGGTQIRQPWAWLILNAGKDIENRDWRTDRRGRFLIHAGKGMTRSEYGNAAYTLEDAGSKIILPAFEMLDRGGIVGSVELVDCVQRSESPWFFGDYGFVLRDPKALPFVPFKGMLGFFGVPDALIGAIDSSMKAKP